MIKINKLLALRKVSDESLMELQERVECLMPEYGYARDGEFIEQEGRMKVHTYFGVDNQFLIYKFVENGRGMLKLREDSEEKDWFDVLISLMDVPENIAKDFARNLKYYNKPLRYFDERNSCEDFVEAVGFMKQEGETRRDFRERIDHILRYYNFHGGEFMVSEKKDFLYKIYENFGGQIIDATFAGDNVLEGIGFDYIAQDVYYHYGNGHDEEISDAALIFKKVSEEIMKGICRDLEKKLI